MSSESEERESAPLTFAQLNALMERIMRPAIQQENERTMRDLFQRNRLLDLLGYYDSPEGRSYGSYHVRPGSRIPNSAPVRPLEPVDPATLTTPTPAADVWEHEVVDAVQLLEELMTDPATGKVRDGVIVQHIDEALREYDAEVLATERERAAQITARSTRQSATGGVGDGPHHTERDEGDDGDLDPLRRIDTILGDGGLG